MIRAMSPRLFLPLAGAALLGLAAGCGKADEDAGVLTPVQAARSLDEHFAEAPPDVQQTVRVASEALREGNAEKAVVALQTARSQPTLTLDQGLAVHNSLVALEHQLIAAADAGDENAKRAYELLKRVKRN